jgi:hypothetical protein
MGDRRATLGHEVLPKLARTHPINYYASRSLRWRLRAVLKYCSMFRAVLAVRLDLDRLVTFMGCVLVLFEEGHVAVSIESLGECCCLAEDVQSSLG